MVRGAPGAVAACLALVAASPRYVGWAETAAKTGEFGHCGCSSVAGSQDMNTADSERALCSP